MQQTGLFDEQKPKREPLAHKIRPDELEDFFGQKQAQERIKRLDFQRLPHLILWGPAGCGKTTLALLLAKKAKMELFQFNAVTSGVPELRKLIAKAQEVATFDAKASIIFIDEIHRFNKAQQDALLPHLEKGDFILFGATTQYPQTALNRALLSRVQLWGLSALSESETLEVLKRAQRKIGLELEDNILAYIARHANGDARSALNQLEILDQNREHLKGLGLEEIKKRYLFHQRQYDKDSDRHYDVISAFIKSIRGSDVDATLLWLAVMLDGGESPDFIARRLIISASEDIGNADPQALTIACNAHYATTKIGMPEARIPLAQACVYLAKAPKSNASYLGINKALEYVRHSQTIQVPTHLRNHHPDKKNYLYPHNYPNAKVEQTYHHEGETFYVDK